MNDIEFLQHISIECEVIVKNIDGIYWPMQRDKNKYNAEYWEATAGGFCTASAISD